MTRAEAIRRLKTLRNYCRSIIRDEYEGGTWEQNIEALDIAIEELRSPTPELAALWAENELLKADRTKLSQNYDTLALLEAVERQQLMRIRAVLEKIDLEGE